MIVVQYCFVMYMNIFRKLTIRGVNADRTILFGETTTDNEKQEVYKLRYKIYSEQGYIDSTKYSNLFETDEYDSVGKSQYFIAAIKEKDNLRLIGCIRSIFSDVLPTELAFYIKEPEELRSIPRANRFEIGRFVIVPPDKLKKDYLPRGIVMLFLLNTVSNYAIKKNLLGGYAFIKQSLNIKLRRLKFPVGYIKEYKQHYPKHGVLYKYFTQVNDPVIPIFFVTKLFFQYTENIICNRFMFRREGDNTFLFRSNVYTYILKVLKIL